MRLAARCAGIAMAGLAIGSAQAVCLKANTPDQVIEGRLTSVRISFPDYKLRPARVTGEPFGEHTAHHHAPIVLGVTRIEPAGPR